MGIYSPIRRAINIILFSYFIDHCHEDLQYIGERRINLNFVKDHKLRPQIFKAVLPFFLDYQIPQIPILKFWVNIGYKDGFYYPESYLQQAIPYLA